MPAGPRARAARARGGGACGRGLGRPALRQPGRGIVGDVCERGASISGEEECQRGDAGGGALAAGCARAGA